MQATEFGKRDDRAEARRLDRPPVGCILVEREVSAGPVIVREVGGEDAAQVPLAENDDMFQALAPDRADESLREGILPRAMWRRENLLDPHALSAMSELLTVDSVTITEEIGWCGVVWEGVDDLLGGPVGGGVLGHIEVDDPPAVVGEHDKHEEHPQARGGDREEVEGDQVANMIGEERPPGLGRRGAPLRDQ